MQLITQWFLSLLKSLRKSWSNCSWQPPLTASWWQLLDSQWAGFWCSLARIQDTLLFPPLILRSQYKEQQWKKMEIWLLSLPLPSKKALSTNTLPAPNLMSESKNWLLAPSASRLAFPTRSLLRGMKMERFKLAHTLGCTASIVQIQNLYQLSPKLKNKKKFEISRKSSPLVE